MEGLQKECTHSRLTVHYSTTYPFHLLCLYSFTYPKWADNNRGFLSSILLLLLCDHPELPKTNAVDNQWLHDLHQVTQSVFPFDERHSLSSDSSNTPSLFKPHVSLIYAPLSNSKNLEKALVQEVKVVSETHVLDAKNNILNIQICRPPDHTNVFPEKNQASVPSTLLGKLQRITQGHENAQPYLTPKYLSVWDTRGKISNWQRLAHVKLET